MDDGAAGWANARPSLSSALRAPGCFGMHHRYHRTQALAIVAQAITINKLWASTIYLMSSRLLLFHVGVRRVPSWGVVPTIGPY